MKKIIKHTVWMLVALFAIVSCAPQEADKYSLEALNTITDDQLSYSQAISDQSDNVITFKNTSQLSTTEYVITWDLGNGVKKTGKDESIVAQYPFKGDYTVTMTVANNNTSASKSAVIRIADNDFRLLDVPVYNNLTGGSSDPDGKTWVFDQYNNFTKEVVDAVSPFKEKIEDPNLKSAAFDIKGHMGLGPQNSYGQNWWGAAPEDKKAWTMYDYKFTFKQSSSLDLKIETKGDGYGRKASASSVGKFDVEEEIADDAFFPYNGGDYSFSIAEGGQFPQITLTGNAFMGYYCGNQTYDIIYQTDKVMALRVDNYTEKQDWVFIYCLQELNVPKPKPLKAVPLKEDFEKETASVVFSFDNMGEFADSFYSNPHPTVPNASKKVFLYEKTNAFYSNVFFMAENYKFDLKKQNKIRVKVYIPSNNDYTTENKTAGTWISESRLRPQLAVKLHNSSLGGDAYTTQTEIVKKDLQTDKWLQLEFDFSNAADRQDYDKIVLQFGGEGHEGRGFFFFDDFEFAE
ncbi:MAG TPA: hypothetical protein DDZ96_13340 [Porphyromonadaceae bacterium]|jgi:hypothetical protein|nr:hypothetical protein [Porphyromonadaceae bacterium]HBK31468.1 hypothetical protein [Porphyromonadaceae bacterium]HBL34780.1 hypothetical protein [Porphyromonadaceae bacterium]HBX21422.1 hypothetical protein [Porphyromonadaceae bacterium]HCM21919.1 hypothetical protein [Porphyromonadaceae bacterium]